MKNVELGPEEIALIATAREALVPSEMARARVRKGLDAKIAAGVAAPFLVTSTALAMALKVGAGIAVAAALSTGLVVVAIPHRSHVSSLRPAFAPSHVNAAPAPQPAERPAPSPPSAMQPVAASETRAAVTPARVPPRRHGVGHDVAAAPADLAGELALLTQINAATKQNDVGRADTLLRSYDQHYPAGQLAQERAAAGILLDCAAGRTQAAQAGARRFLEAWPHSPLVARIQDACAAGSQAP